MRALIEANKARIADREADEAAREAAELEASSANTTDCPGDTSAGASAPAMVMPKQS